MEFIPTINPIINLATVATQKLENMNNKQPQTPIISETNIIYLLPNIDNNTPITMHPIAAPKGTADVKIPIK